MLPKDRYDLIVVGAGIAGTSTAALMAQSGLSVKILEKRSGEASTKSTCGHFVLSGAANVISELGLWDEILKAGAVLSTAGITSAEGSAVSSRVSLPPCFSLVRSELDLVLRRNLRKFRQVDVEYGARIVSVDSGSGNGSIVEYVDGNGESQRVAGRLIVGADGTYSSLAGLVGAGAEMHANDRSFHWAYFAGVNRPVSRRASLFLEGTDVFAAFPTSGDLLQLGAFVSESSGLYDRCRPNERAQLILDRMKPLLGNEFGFNDARCVKSVTVREHCFVSRNPNPSPGVALVGDAAFTADPTHAAGCSLAFRGASLLRQTVGASLLARDGNSSTALRLYRRRYRRMVRFESINRIEAGNPKRLVAPLKAARMAALSSPLSREILLRQFLQVQGIPSLVSAHRIMEY